MCNKDRLVFLVLISVLTALTFFQFLECAKAKECRLAEDFTLFYQAASNTLQHNNDKIYDVNAAKSALIHLKAQEETDFHPFLYPPQSLLLIAPLAYLSYDNALVAWFFLPIILLIFILKNAAFLREESFTTLSIIFLPFLMVAFVAGQNSAFWAACFMGVIAWRKSHPVIAALALAMFAIKPQLGIFLPVLLLYEKNWRVLINATCIVLLMMISATQLFGAGLWQDYAHVAQLFSDIQKLAPSKYVYVSASPYMALRMLALPSYPAYSLQILISMLTLFAVWKSLEKCQHEKDKITLLCLATLLFSPYSYIYDAILLAYPCIVFFSDKTRRIPFILLVFIPIIAVRLQFMQLPYCFIVISFAFLHHIIHLRQTVHD